MSLPSRSDLNKILNHTLSYAAYAILTLWVGHALFSSAFIQQAELGDLSAVQTALASKEHRTQALLRDLARQVGSRDFDREFNQAYYEHSGLYDDEGIVILGYQNDSLAFWSNNSAPVDLLLDASSFHSPIIRLRNGWYQTIEFDTLNKKYRGMVLIKTQYAFENQYLVNEFQRDFNIPGNANIQLFESEESTQITDAAGDYLFSIEFGKGQNPDGWKYLVLVLLNLIGIVCLFILFHRGAMLLRKRLGAAGSMLVFMAAVFLVRYLSLQYFFPRVFSELNLFDPTFYATSSIFPSLGDFMINGLLMLLLAYYVDKRLNLRKIKKFPKGIWSRLLVIGLFSGLFIFSIFISDLMRGLIKDSSINFDINNLFTLNWYSYVGIFIIGTLFLTFYILTNKLVAVIRRMEINGQEILLHFSAITLLFVIGNHLFGRRDLILVLWPAMVILTVVYCHYRSGGRYAFSTVVTLLIIFSFFSSHTLSKYVDQKEKENREVFAQKLSSDEDPVTEWEYPNLEGEMLNDEIVRIPFDTAIEFDKSDFDKTLQQQFFNGYWDKYEMRSYIFGRDSVPIGVGTNAQSRDFAQLEKMILLYGARSDLSPNLYYIHNSEERVSYIIKLPLYVKPEQIPYGFMYFELASKLIPEEIGFPALLLDKNSSKVDGLSNYSYARYVDKRLINRMGAYNYPVTLRIFEQLKGEGRFLDYDDYNHFFYRVDETTRIVLSRQSESVLGRVTSFSYLFASFSIILLLVIFFNNFPQGLRIDNVGLQVKVQLLIVGVLLTSLILFVVGTRYYIEEEYKEKNNNLISEKIHSVQIEVFNKLGGEVELNEQLKPYMTYILRKFSRVFFTDINLYSLEGNLLASSRAKIFDEGLISEKMSPEAYIHIGLNEKSTYIIEEEIGGLRYLSAYVPFRNKQNEILAYLNLPYFAKQDELENEISDFLVAIINIFVLLFGFSLVAALFVSNWITKPLKRLQQSFANLELGKENQQLEYQGRDEIGALVDEYNKKVLELEYNSQRLARSERESAWREMAKQVAHEIKNPLTPMKLRVQHLQMSYDKDDPEWEDRLSKFTAMLIEQIDTLSNIANEFSNFAKMPKANFEKVDLVHALRSTKELYQDTDDVEISYESDLPGEQVVMADKEQLIRVFNNLVKNAIQAIPDTQEGKILLSLEYTDRQYIVIVKDNGTGIDDEKYDKIFVPNFTTKSTGMGLGLAMVKNIVENCGGKVWFESKVDVGSSFFVALPAYSEEDDRG
jgi:two-component system nitrogen regulation sensor histidine kinase NtrY